MIYIVLYREYMSSIGNEQKAIPWKEAAGLKLEKLLDAIQGQRHDFLNHLQVIAGLLQLKKVDRAMDYLKQVSNEVAKYSHTSKVTIPELSAALLIAINEAAMLQIELVLSINSDLAKCAVPGAVVSNALEICLNSAFETIAMQEIEERRRLEVVFAEREQEYTCRLLFPEPLLADLKRFEATLVPAVEMLSPYGGALDLALANNGVKIFFTLPRQGFE
jgi:hypothetical protein